MNVTSPPRSPPSNLTVVTVEGCPSFVILDWEKSDNDTTGMEKRCFWYPLNSSNTRSWICRPPHRVWSHLHRQRSRWWAGFRSHHQPDPHSCREPKTREQVCLLQSPQTIIFRSKSALRTYSPRQTSNLVWPWSAECQCSAPPQTAHTAALQKFAEAKASPGSDKLKE